MSNETRTRRLIVTLPNVTTDEAISIADDLEYADGEWGHELFGSALAGGVNVVHAPDDELIDDRYVVEHGPSNRLAGGFVELFHSDGGSEVLSARQARVLAAHLLRAADESESVARCSACGSVLVCEDCPNYGDGPEHAKEVTDEWI